MTFSITTRVPPKTPLVAPAGELAGPDVAYAWEADLGATWYRLWVNRNGSAWYTHWYYTGPTNGVLSPPPVAGHPLGRYEWWVRAWGPDGNAPWSDSLAFTYGLSATVSPTGVVTATRQPTFEWQAANGADWYLVSIERGGSEYLRQWLSNTTNWTVGTPLPYGSYTWRVQTWGNGDYGPWSTPAGFLIGAAVPLAPSGALGASPTELRWDNDGCREATWYRVWIERDGVLHWSDWVARAVTGDGPGQERLFADAALFPLPSGAYTWYIRAFSNAGYGPWSGGMTFTVP